MNKVIKTINDLSYGYNVYAVGGFVRDLLLKRQNEDIDLAVNKDPLKYSKILAKAFKAKLITLDKTTQTYRIILQDSEIKNIDVSLFCSHTIEEDLQKRDISVNSIAFNLKDFNDFKKHIVLPKKDALKDLNTKTLNIVSSKVFKTDPLRMLRGFRFMAEQGFNFSQSSLNQVKNNAKLISKVAKERVKNELSRIFASKNAAEVLELMDKTGLLSAVLPDCAKMKKVAKKHYYHKGGLFEHSFRAFKSSENILNSLKKYFPQNYIDLQKHFEDNSSFSEYVTRKGLIKIVSLLHDNAKPETASFENGKMHFFDHEKKGSQKIKKIMSDLKFSKKDMEFSAFLVRHHMRPSTLTRNNIVTKKASLKLFRDMGDFVLDLLIVSMADWHSYKNLKGFSKRELSLQEQSVRELVRYYYDLKHSKPLKKIVDGNIIIKEFSLKPGPIIGELLENVLAAQQEGKVSTLKEAVENVSLITSLVYNG
ncbi:MAG: HD domain-containing protein, partial [Endomicrobium sp.]|nr:HD domain-containing protein [Endomicrobium sp.]